MTDLDLRIPKWQPQSLEPRSCPMCQAENERALSRRDGLDLSFCPSCSLWYVSTIPGQDDLTAFYEDYFSAFRSQELDSFLAHRLARQAEEPDERLERLDAVLGGLEGRKVLEIGCGLGQFLIKARGKGAQAVGIDLCEEACAFAREHFGLDVSGVTLEQYAERGERVDAVVMNDLIEHIADLDSFLASVDQLLKKDGVVLVWTPNGGAAGRSAATGADWLGFQVDFEHLQFFSPKSLSVLAVKYGWSLEHLETRGFPDLRGVGLMNARRSKGRVHALLQRFPGLKRSLWELKSAVARGVRRPGPQRGVGNYHLFAILRKG